jgi:hypothetical protein
VAPAGSTRGRPKLCRCWPAGDLGARRRPAQPERGRSDSRGESGPCDPCRRALHRRICAPGICRPGLPYSPRRRAERGHERRTRSRRAEAGPGRAVPARLRQAALTDHETVLPRVHDDGRDAR